MKKDSEITTRYAGNLSTAKNCGLSFGVLKLKIGCCRALLTFLSRATNACESLALRQNMLTNVKFRKYDKKLNIFPLKPSSHSESGALLRAKPLHANSESTTGLFRHKLAFAYGAFTFYLEALFFLGYIFSRAVNAAIFSFFRILVNNFTPTKRTEIRHITNYTTKKKR